MTGARLLGGLALTLSPAWAARQRTGLEGQSAASVVEAVGSMLEEHGSDGKALELIERMSTDVTPGVDADFVSTFKAAVPKIETDIEAKIKAGQKATQEKLDSTFAAFGVAAAKFPKGKQAADASDEAWFNCIAEQQSSLQKIAAAKKELTSSRSGENEACQQMQDSDDFLYQAPSVAEPLQFQCKLAGAGDCDAQLAEYEKTLEKVMQDADAKLQANQTHYATLKSACDGKKAARVKAQNAENGAKLAFGRKKAECDQLNKVRLARICLFGKDLQTKCAAEVPYSQLVAATKKVNGDALSEVDRVKEWKSTAVTKCMFEKYISNGAAESINSADLDACHLAVNFSTAVGALNLREAEFKALAGQQPCVQEPVKFFNGQTWNVPKNAASPAYTRVVFTPTISLNPKRVPFPFCEGVDLGEADGTPKFAKGSVLHKIQKAEQCGVTWNSVPTQRSATIDKSMFHIGTTLASWGCDRLAASPGYGRLLVDSTEYVVVSCGAADPCETDDASCECFKSRDPTFCNTCKVDCGPCREACGFPPK